MTTFPKGYRAFRVGKLVRTRILIDIHRRQGHLWAHKPEGTPLVFLLFDKLEEELAECHTAFATGDAVTLREELADLVEAVQFAYTALGNVISGDFPPPPEPEPSRTLENAQQAIAELNAKAKGRPLSTQAVTLTYAVRLAHQAAFNTLGATLRMPVTLTRGAVVQAMREKRREKGPLEGWFLEAAALPAADEWCPVYAAKFAELPPARLTLQQATAPADLTRAA